MTVEAMRVWAAQRLIDCDRTQRTSSHRRERDYAYGESVAIRAMLAILDGKVKP